MEVKDMGIKDIAADFGKSILYDFGKLIGKSCKIIKEGYEDGKKEKTKKGTKNDNK